MRKLQYRFWDHPVRSNYSYVANKTFPRITRPILLRALDSEQTGNGVGGLMGLQLHPFLTDADRGGRPATAGVYLKH